MNWLATSSLEEIKCISTISANIHVCAIHFDVADIRRGDNIYGVLPVHIAAEICRRGGRYFHVTFNSFNIVDDTKSSFRNESCEILEYRIIQYTHNDLWSYDSETI